MNRSLFTGAAFTAMFAALLIVSASCSPQRAQSGQTTTLRYGFISEPVTLDPLSPANTADGRSLLFNVFEGLVKPDTEGRLLPCIAESILMEEQGRVYYFKLRENIRFHDGSLLTSADVYYSLNTAQDAGFLGLDLIEHMETDGDYGIRVTLFRPDPLFLPYLTAGIVRAGSTDRDRNAVGTGPYFIESYQVQQSLVLRKFEDYWQEGVPRLEMVTIVFMADADALVLGLHGGSLDGAGLPGSLAQQLDPVRFDHFPGYSAMVHLLALNNASEPLNDIRVRQAINYGIDIQEIIDTAFYGHGEPSGSPIIPGLSVYYNESLADPYPVDHAKARLLLQEAGFSGRLSLEIIVPSIFTMHVDTAQVIAGQLAEIGIDVNIQLVDWATWLDDVYFGRNYQATIISLDSPIVSPGSFLSRYRSDDGNNFINYSNAGFDQVYDATLVETDAQRRIELYREAQRIVSDDAASVFIQDILGFRVFRAGAYSGVLSYPLYVIDFASMYGR